MEQFLVNLRHAAEELDVVNQKAIHAANPFPERGQGADLLRVGEARRERFAGHVQHFRFLRMGGDVVPDRMEEMGLPEARAGRDEERVVLLGDRKSTRLNSSHGYISYAVLCLKKKKTR